MHRARKRFGQHFLTDTHVIERIVQAFRSKPDECLIEIGPGQGALTLPLVKQGKELTLIELDRDLAALLAACRQLSGKIQLIQQDILTVDIAKLAGKRPVRIIGNLPYNITTPLLFHLLDSKADIRSMLFMVQIEVAERLGASVNTAAYGKLSIMIQLAFKVQVLFSVPPTAFSPPPKVYSAVIGLQPIHPKDRLKIDDKALFSAIVTEAFRYRRKTLRNALASYFTEEALVALHIDPKARPAELRALDYALLANDYLKTGESHV